MVLRMVAMHVDTLPAQHEVAWLGRLDCGLALPFLMLRAFAGAVIPVELPSSAPSHASALTAERPAGPAPSILPGKRLLGTDTTHVTRAASQHIPP